MDYINILIISGYPWTVLNVMLITLNIPTPVPITHRQTHRNSVKFPGLPVVLSRTDEQERNLLLWPGDCIRQENAVIPRLEEKGMCPFTRRFIQIRTVVAASEDIHCFTKSGNVYIAWIKINDVRFLQTVKPFSFLDKMEKSWIFLGMTNFVYSIDVIHFV